MEETKPSKQRIIVAVIFGVALLVGVVFAVITIAGSNDEQTETQTTQTQQQTQDDADEQETYTVSFTAEAGRTVLEQTHEHAEVETEDAGMGEYVIAMDGMTGGDDNRFWTYYIDGEPAAVGAGDYVTEGGETVEWRFESFE